MTFSKSRKWFYFCACTLFVSALLVVPTIAQANSEPRPTVPNSNVNADCTGIQGRVFLDLDGDGTRNKGERGLAGIKITIKDLEHNITKNHKTGKNGAFKFLNLTGGKWQVSVTVPSTKTATTRTRVQVSAPPCQVVNFGMANKGAADQPTPTVTPVATETAVPTTAPAPTTTAESVSGSWTSNDIGTTTAGTTAQSGTALTIKGSGSDIWDTSDTFRYVYVSNTGDVDLKAKITQFQGSSDGWSKAGVMLRSTNAANAAFADVVISGSNGIRFMVRSSNGATTASLGGPASFTFPIWVRLKKVGTTVTGYYSQDGSNWSQINQPRTVSLSGTYLYGLAVTAHKEGSFATAVFDNVGTGGTTYYLDCGGSDSNNGTSTGSAWKTLTKANASNLQPGESLLLKRGCAWSGRLRAYWIGTATQPIIIGAYGSGASPIIQDDSFSDVEIEGSYLTIQDLETRMSSPPNPDPGCNNQPVGYFVGFNFRQGAQYNTLQNSNAHNLTIGVNLAQNTSHNRVFNSSFTNNNVMQYLTPKSVNPSDDLGAWGAALHGNYQEIAYNYFSNNNAICVYDTGIQGNSIELYEAQFNNIHHNTSLNDVNFSELGGSTNIKSTDNTFAYNTYQSNAQGGLFVIVRGTGNSYGPTSRTLLYNNTVYLTGANSQGVVCHAGCSTSILTARNNIFWAEWKSIYADGAFNESNNVYWASNGLPFVQFLNFTMSPTSKLINPVFTNLGAGNFHLQGLSGAINKGSTEAMNKGYNLDLDSISVPQSSAPDIGAYEYH